MRIQVSSRASLLSLSEAREFLSRWKVLSVCTPAFLSRSGRLWEEEPLPLPEDLFYSQGNLRLLFHDLEEAPEEPLPPSAPPIRLFSSEQAKQIWEWVLSPDFLQGKEGLWIHCTAGKSRSQAIGRTLSDWVNLSGSPAFSHLRPSRQDWEEREREAFLQGATPSARVGRILAQTAYDLGLLPFSG